jgi:hypothetical protein
LARRPTIWPRELHILHPKLQRLEEPQAAAIHQHRREPGHSGQPAQQQAHLVAVEDDGETNRLLGAHDRLDRPELAAEHVLVQKEQRAQCLRLARRAEPLGIGQ